MLRPFLRHTKHIIKTETGRSFHIYVPNDYPTFLHPHNGRVKATKKRVTRRMRRARRKMQAASRKANR